MFAVNAHLLFSKLKDRYLKAVCKKYFSCDKACQCSDLSDMFCQSYLKKTKIETVM